MERNHFLERKKDEILSCLNGVVINKHGKGSNNEDYEKRVVNLWHLRALALSRGGLVCATIRKLAWTKLVGVSEHVILSTTVGIAASYSLGISGTSDNLPKENIVPLQTEDLQIIEQDMGRSVWPIEVSIQELRKKRKKEEKELQQKWTLREEQTTYIPGKKNNQNANKASSVTNKSRSKCIRREGEQAVLLNIIITVLRSTPPQEENNILSRGKDNRLHYYQGLHDIVALFLINLESPSLTSLIVGRLCQSHLRDPMRSDFTAMEAGMRITFMPLLNVVDSSLHDHIIKSGVDLETCIFSWILTWFSHDFLNVEVASRLLDLFLASHALMPIYLSVAILTLNDNRKEIFDADDFTKLHMVLKELPMNMVASLDGNNLNNDMELMDLFDDLIESAVSFM